MSEREYRISGREYEPLTSERVEEILDDTGADCPAGDYCSADVYALAREVVRLQADLSCMTAARDAWQELAELRSKLLVCYRLEKQPSDRLLNRIQALEGRLGES